MPRWLVAVVVCSVAGFAACGSESSPSKWYLASEGGSEVDGATSDGGCFSVADDTHTSCVNGVVTVHSSCPSSETYVGTCTYGCFYPGAFGSASLADLCYPAPPPGSDGGCDGTCGDGPAER